MLGSGRRTALEALIARVTRMPSLEWRSTFSILEYSAEEVPKAGYSSACDRRTEG